MPHTEFLGAWCPFEVLCYGNEVLKSVSSTSSSAQRWSVLPCALFLGTPLSLNTELGRLRNSSYLRAVWPRRELFCTALAGRVDELSGKEPAEPPLGNVAGTCPRVETSLPLLSCSSCFSRIAPTAVRTNITFVILSVFAEIRKAVPVYSK